MSLFKCEAIPDHLLRGSYAEDTDGETDFEDDIITLKAYSLISVGIARQWLAWSWGDIDEKTGVLNFTFKQRSLN